MNSSERHIAIWLVIVMVAVFLAASCQPQPAHAKTKPKVEETYTADEVRQIIDASAVLGFEAGLKAANAKGGCNI